MLERVNFKCTHSFLTPLKFILSKSALSSNTPILRDISLRQKNFINYCDFVTQHIGLVYSQLAMCKVMQLVLDKDSCIRIEKSQL